VIGGLQLSPNVGLVKIIVTGAGVAVTCPLEHAPDFDFSVQLWVSWEVPQVPVGTAPVALTEEVQPNPVLVQQDTLFPKSCLAFV
jgi:hypothetical protein